VVGPTSKTVNGLIEDFEVVAFLVVLPEDQP